jgi:cysteine-rich repeat protein
VRAVEAASGFAVAVAGALIAGCASLADVDPWSSSGTAGAAGGRGGEGGGDAPASTGPQTSSSAAGGAGGSGGATGAGAGGAGPTGCGDGIIVAPEQCDDGGQAPGDGCDAACLVECAPPGLLDLITHHCYRFDAGLTDWAKAKVDCEMDFGGYLTALTSQGELDAVSAWVFASVGNSDFWIGGNDIDADGTYVWVNQEAWWDGGWKMGETSEQAQEDCVLVAAISWDLADHYCSAMAPFVCEREPKGTEP